MSLPSVLGPISTYPGTVRIPGTRPDVIAHRGGAGLNPENTITAFDHAVRLGCTTLETDVQQTADGVAVAFHDDTLDRVTNLTGPIRAYTWDQLRQATVYGPGGLTGTIPTIEELLGRYETNWIIDVKNSDSIVPLANAINATNSADRVCVAHAWDAWLEAIRSLTSPHLQRALGWRGLAGLVACASAGRKPYPGMLTAPWVHIGWRAGGVKLMKRKKLSTKIIDLAHEMGMGVRVWTINDPKKMNRLFDQGVDGVFTDYPDLGLYLRQRF